MSVSEKTGTLVCQPGNMELSKNLNDLLIACYVTGTEERTGLLDPAKFYSGGFGGRWFCPGCGGRCHEAVPGIVQCEKCGRDMARFIYPLVEIHPHNKVGT
jgi:hypothetical protein